MRNKKIKYFVVFVIIWSVYALLSIFVCSSYKIISSSMEPTLLVGHRVYINKLLLGARFRYSYKDCDGVYNECFARLKGLRRICPNDIICFNFPHRDNLKQINFNKNVVYCKRVLGTPGCRIGAVDGHYWNDKYLKPIGSIKTQENMRWMYDSIFVWNNCYKVFSEAENNWNIKNWGPLYVPAKGTLIKIDKNNRELYRQIIEYELGDYLDEKVTEYVFKENYYFVVGDNVINSNDSRYWGFIPEDFIIGIVGGRRVKNRQNH